jgi:hypothetical protein
MEADFQCRHLFWLVGQWFTNVRASAYCYVWSCCNMLWHIGLWVWVYVQMQLTSRASDVATVLGGVSSRSALCNPLPLVCFFTGRCVLTLVLTGLLISLYGIICLVVLIYCMCMDFCFEYKIWFLFFLFIESKIRVCLPRCGNGFLNPDRCQFNCDCVGFNLEFPGQFLVY